jgi:hypothetical protein
MRSALNPIVWNPSTDPSVAFGKKFSLGLLPAIASGFALITDPILALVLNPSA